MMQFETLDYIGSYFQWCAFTFSLSVKWHSTFSAKIRFNTNYVSFNLLPKTNAATEMQR